MTEPTHYVSDQIAEGPRTPAELPESRYEAALQLWWEWFAGGGRAVPPIPDDTSLMLQWIVGRFRAATRETRGTATMEINTIQDKLNPGDWRVEAIDFENEGIVYVTIFSGPEAQKRAEYYSEWLTAARVSQPVAPPPPEIRFTQGAEPCCGEISAQLAIRQGWIPVEERLPDGSECVLVYAPTADSDLDSPIQVAWYAKQSLRWEGEIFSLTERVTHWQPLPSPPSRAAAPAGTQPAQEREK